MKKFLMIAFFLIMGNSIFAQVLKKGNVTETMGAGRIVDGQEVVFADLPFTKGQGLPFSIMIVPKSDLNTKEIEILKGRYYQDDTTKDIPLVVNQWNTTAIVNITTDNADLFTDYRVFVGFGHEALN